MTIQENDLRIWLNVDAVNANNATAIPGLALRKTSTNRAALRREGGQYLLDYRQQCPWRAFEPWLPSINMAKSTALRWIELAKPTRPNPEDYEFRGDTLVIGFTGGDFAAFKAVMDAILQLDPSFDLADWMTHALADGLHDAAGERIRGAWCYPVATFKKESLNEAGQPHWQNAVWV